MSETPPPYDGPVMEVPVTAVIETQLSGPGLSPLVRVLRTLMQVLVVVAGVLPAAIIATNTMAEQAGIEWRVPPSAWVAASVGAGLVVIVAAVQNAIDSKRGNG